MTKPVNTEEICNYKFDIASCKKKYFQKCQIYTPKIIIQKLWEILHIENNYFDTVLDLGAGDARFSEFGNYGTYTGVEIDTDTKSIKLPSNVHIKYQCAFSLKENDFDLCIGNPPYVRHQELEVDWKKKNAKILSLKLGETFSQRSNIFVYFLAQALIKTHNQAKVALIIPFEWATRPSSQSIRNYIDKNKWSVNIYRFEDNIFPGVLTTASITIIDKTNLANEWSYFSVDKNFKARKSSQPTGTSKKLLSYTQRNDAIYAQRGLSPGNQKIFCLTEEERIKHNLRINVDVIPCIVSLKPLSKENKVLTEKLFYKQYVNNNQRCWLVNSSFTDISDSLKRYLESVLDEDKNTWTCNNREIWWEYPKVTSPKILYSSSFTTYGPKIVLNRFNVIAVNSAFGIYINTNNFKIYKFIDFMKSYDFESRIVNHAGKLKRIEVNQMNSVIQKFLSKV